MSKFNFNAKTSVSVAALEANTDKGTEQATETVVNTDSEGETQKARAIAFASQESEEMSAAIEQVANAKEDWQGGPIKVLFALRETYGEEIDQFPKPDLETGNNPDKFKVSMTNDAGVTAMRATSFYQLFADATKEGKAIVDELAFIKRLSNVNDKKDGIPSELIDLYLDDEDKRTARTHYLNGRRSTIKASYKKAMALYFQMDAVASLPFCQADFVWVVKDGEETGEVEGTTKPIVVRELLKNGERGNKREFFSIGSFLKLDAKAASEKGGTLKELMKTVARDTNPKAATFPTIKTADSFTKGFVELFRAMDEFQSDPDQKELGKFMKILNVKKDSGADQLKASIIEMRNYLDDICDELKLGQWYADLQAKRDPLVTRKAA